MTVNHCNFKYHCAFWYQIDFILLAKHNDFLWSMKYVVVGEVAWYNVVLLGYISKRFLIWENYIFNWVWRINFSLYNYVNML